MIEQQASVLQPEHLLIILLIVVLLFGGKKIPELMRGLGQGVREFNAAKSNIKQEIEEGMKDKPVSNSGTVPNTTKGPAVEQKEETKA
jgi:sec-independent protein translocase protein TatA